MPRRITERRRGSARLCRTGRLPPERAAIPVPGKHRAVPLTAGGRRRASGRTGRITRRPRTRLAFVTIVHPGQATAARAAATLRRRGLQRLTRTATARIILAAGALASRRNGVTAGRHTGTAATASSLLIRREPILRRAAAIRHRLALTLRLAAATAAEAATAATVAVLEEAAVTEEAEALAATVAAVGVPTAAVAAVAAFTAEAEAGAVAPTAAVAAVAADRIDNPSF